MAGINKVLVKGNLGRDPEMRGSACKLAVGSTRRWFSKKTDQYEEETEWVRVTVFGKSGENCMEHLRVGAPVLVEGRLHTSSYEKNGEKRYSTEVIADEVHWLGTPPKKSDFVETVTKARDQASQPQSWGGAGHDDGIPFAPEW